MATYKAHSYLKGTTLRPGSQVDAEEATLTLSIPDGKAVVAADIWQFGYIGEDVRVLSVEIDNSASLAASGITINLGTDAAATAFLSGASFGNGGVTVLEAIDGATAGSSANNFAVTPYVVQTSRKILQAVVGGTIGTPTTSGTRSINLRVRFQYAYPETYVSGVSNVTYPLAGTKSTLDAIRFDYNGAAP